MTTDKARSMEKQRGGFANGDDKYYYCKYMCQSAKRLNQDTNVKSLIQQRYIFPMESKSVQT